MPKKSKEPQFLEVHTDKFIHGGQVVGTLQSGQKVLVLEQHPDRTGGCTHSFRQENCEWDTGLHYTSMGMSQRTQRPGALLHFMTKGKQAFVRLQGTQKGDGNEKQRTYMSTKITSHHTKKPTFVSFML